MQGIDPPMHRQLLPVAPGRLEDIRVANIVNLLHHVQLTKPIHLLLLAQASQSDFVFGVDVLDVTEPVVDQPHRLIPQRRPHAPALIVAADDDVLDLQHLHRVLHDREAVEIGVNHQVGHIPVNKQFPRLQPDQRLRWHPAVRAANPKVFRSLSIRKVFKKTRVASPDLLSPFLVQVKKVLQTLHAGEDKRTCSTHSPTAREKV